MCVSVAIVDNRHCCLAPLSVFVCFPIFRRFRLGRTSSAHLFFAVFLRSAFYSLLGYCLLFGSPCFTLWPRTHSPFLLSPASCSGPALCVLWWGTAHIRTLLRTSSFTDGPPFSFFFLLFSLLRASFLAALPVLISFARLHLCVRVRLLLSYGSNNHPRTLQIKKGKPVKEAAPSCLLPRD